MGTTTFGLVDYNDFSGGLDDTTPSTKLPANKAQTARNWNIRPGGGLSKRSGSVKLNSSAIAGGAAITHIGEFVKSDGTKFILCTAGTKLFKMDAMDGTWDDLSLTLTDDDNALVTEAKMNNLYVICNGAEAPQKYDGSSAGALGGSPPTGKIIIHVNNFFFIANHTGNKSRIQWSDLATPETWTGTNFLDLDPNDGDEITAVGSLFNNLYIFKNRSIHRMPIINSPFGRERVATKLGCVGRKAIVNVGGTHLFFLTPDGRFISFDGSVVSDVSSRTISQKMASLNPTRWKFTSMIDYQKRQQIWITISTGSNSTHNELLIYDYTTGITSGAWMIFTGIAANALLAVTDQRSTSTEKEIMLSGDFSGFVRIQDSGTANDDGGVIDAFWETGWNFFESQQAIKVVRKAEVLATEEGDYEVSFKVGFDFETGFQFTTDLSLASGGAKWDVAIWGIDVWSGRNILQIPTILGGYGKAIKFGIQSNKDGQELSLLRGFTITMSERGTRVAKTGQ